jgi:hypothetical protein
MPEAKVTRREFMAHVGAGVMIVSSGYSEASRRGDMAVERIDCSRKTRYWEGERPFPRAVPHPIFYTVEQIERARGRVSTQDWAKRYLEGLVRSIDRRKILEMSDEAIREGISEQVNIPMPRCPVDRRRRGWRDHFWDWSSDDPGHIRCKICESVFPGEEHEPVGELEVVGPAGKVVLYQYWEDDEGIRYFFDNVLLNYTQARIVGLVDPLAMAYTLTGEKAYAHKAAVILDRIAEVYPNYPVHGLGTYYSSADRRGFYENQFFKDPPFPFVSARMGNYHASPFSDASRAFGFSRVYDSISDSGAIEDLSRDLGRDVRKAIEQDLLYEAIRHTLEIPHRATNYDGGRLKGLGLVGRMLGEPEFVDQAFELFQALIDNCYLYDGYWAEDTLNYFAMITRGVVAIPDVLSGPGGIDVYGKMPYLQQIYTAPLGLFMPDGRTLMANDTWSATTLGNKPSTAIGLMKQFVEEADEISDQARIPVGDVEFALFRRSSEASREVNKDDLLALVPQNYLLPGAGNVILGVGKSKGAIRTTFSFGPWGGHHHYDSLSMGLDMFGQELLSDIGYSHTHYREWATAVGSHNTVVIDGQQQTRAGGRLITYHPTSEQKVGLVSAEVPDAFENSKKYRRTMLLVPTSRETGYVVDLFEVEGGDVHDYLLHGSADFDQTVSTDLDLILAEGEMVLSGDGTEGALYGYMKRTKKSEIDGNTAVQFESEGTKLDIRLLEAQGAQLMVSEAPSIRRTQEDDGKLDNFWYNVVCVRRTGGKSRFLSVIEAHKGAGFVRSAELLAQEGNGVVLKVTEQAGTRTFAIDPDGKGIATVLPDGRKVEVVGRAGVITEMIGEEIAKLEILDGSRIQFGESVIERTRDYEGVISEVVGDITGEPSRSELFVDVTLPEDGSLDGKVLYVTHPSEAETVYLVERVEQEGEGSRLFLSGMPRFIRGRGKVASGELSRFESNVEHPKEGCVGCRLRIGDEVFTINSNRGRDTFVLDSEEDFAQRVGMDFEVYSTASGDRFKIVV